MVTRTPPVGRLRKLMRPPCSSTIFCATVSPNPVPCPVGLVVKNGSKTFGSALGGIAMNEMVAWLIENRSYDDCFYGMALLHPVALLLVWPLRKRLRGE